MENHFEKTVANPSAIYRDDVFEKTVVNPFAMHRGVKYAEHKE